MSISRDELLFGEKCEGEVYKIPQGGRDRNSTTVKVLTLMCNFTLPGIAWLLVTELVVLLY